MHPRGWGCDPGSLLAGRFSGGTESNSGHSGSMVAAGSESFLHPCPIYAMRGLIQVERELAENSSTDHECDRPLLQIFNRPVIHYCISVLVEMGIRDILIIARPKTAARYQQVLGNGHDWGLKFSYALSNECNGILESLILGEEFVGSMNCCLMSGDKVFLDAHFTHRICNLYASRGAMALVKPSGHGQSGHSEAGLYIFDSTVFGKIRILGSGNPGIDDLLRLYEHEERMRYEEVEESSDCWMNVDSPEELAKASQAVENVRNTSQRKPGCPEETCWRHGLIDDAQLETLAIMASSKDYGCYLLDVLNGKI